MFKTPAENTFRLVETSLLLSGIEIRGLADGTTRTVDTICIHGDARGAVDIARGVCQLKDSGIEFAEAAHLRQRDNEPADSGVLDDPVAGLQGHEIDQYRDRRLIRTIAAWIRCW